MLTNNENIFRKRIRALEAEESRLRTELERLQEREKEKMRNCNDGYPSCRHAEATGKWCGDECRTYSNMMLKFWGAEIRRAEGLVSGNIPSSGIDDGYVIEIDPEDFLDLCAGKWHGA